MAYKLPYQPIVKVRFQPWVGKNYNSRIPKLLILGMSHYSWGDENLPDYFVTNDVILHQANSPWCKQLNSRRSGIEA